MSTKVDQDGIMFAGKRDERLPPPPCGCPVTRTLMWPPAANFDTIHHRAGCNGLPMCIDVVPNGNGSTSGTSVVTIDSDFVWGDIAQT